MAWRAESYQLVAFQTPHEFEDAFQTWLSIFKSPPDKYQKHPDISLRATIAGGEMYGYEWQLQCAQGRIDIIVNGQSNNSEYPFPVIPDDHVLVDIIRTKIIPDLVNKIRVVRFGLVCGFFKDYEDIESVHKAFTEVTNIELKSNKSLDAIFGVNVRKDIAHLGVTLNRLCNWQALEKQAMQIQIDPSVQEPINLTPQQFVPSVIQPSLVFNIDINTMMRDTVFDVATAGGVCNCMFDEVARLKDGGYGLLIND